MALRDEYEEGTTMRTWDDYKDYVKRIDPESKMDMEEVETIASIVGAVVRERKAKGITQRDLAELCGIPQSSVARIESFQSMPKLETLVRIMKPLGLKLTVSRCS